MITLFAVAQQPEKRPETKDVMVSAVARNDAVLAGGISSGRLKKRGLVDVEPLAWLTPEGNWKRIPCDADHPDECQAFQKEYLQKPHAYTMISADGRGAKVQVSKIALGDCYEYRGEGTYAGDAIRYGGIAASSTEIFDFGSFVKRLPKKESAPILDAFITARGNNLDSDRELRVYSFQLEGQQFFAVQRALQDYGAKIEDAGTNLNSVFAVGTMMQGTFHVLSRSANDASLTEQILGEIHLRSGRDFLITAVNDEESQYFRIYGVHDGKLAVIFSGGGGSC